MIRLQQLQVLLLVLQKWQAEGRPVTPGEQEAGCTDEAARSCFIKWLWLLLLGAFFCVCVHICCWVLPPRKRCTQQCGESTPLNWHLSSTLCLFLACVDLGDCGWALQTQMHHMVWRICWRLQLCGFPQDTLFQSAKVWRLRNMHFSCNWMCLAEGSSEKTPDWGRELYRI